MVRSKRVNDKELSYRTSSVLESTVSSEKRSVDAIAATENPVLMPDYDRMEMVPEVLLMSGVKLPETRRIPLLDNHNRATNDDIIGSAVDLRVEDNKLLSRNEFSEVAKDTFTKVKEGHLKDVSVGYKVDKKIYVPSGKRERIGGRDFTGPVNVVTSWQVRELSVTPMGADEAAKMRGFQGDPFSKKEFTVNKLTRAVLVGRGMAADLDDEKAVDWLVQRGMPKDADPAEWVGDNLDKLETKNTAKTVPAAGDGTRNDAKNVVIDYDAIATKAADSATAKALEIFEQRHAEAARKAAEWNAEVKGICELVGRTDLVDSLASQCKTPAEVRAKLIDIRSKETVALPGSFGRIEFGAEQRDKHLGAIRSALELRSLRSANISDKTIESKLPESKRAAGWTDYQSASLADMARDCLEIDGVNLRGLSREHIGMAAWGFARHVPGIQTRSGAAYHTTSSFLNLTLDASNKTMLAAYGEVEPTWRLCFRQASSVPDFKNINRVRDGASPNLHHLPDNAAPEIVSFSDEKETYSVESYSNRTSFSYRLIVNDDMDALMRTPAKFGAAAARTQNAKVWGVVTDNPTLSDGQALFLETPAGNRKRKNLTTGAGAPSVSTVQTLTNLMSQMRGLNTPEGNESDDILGIQPVFIAFPMALRTTVMQLVRSTYDPAQTNSITYNPANGLVPIGEPLLDVASTTAWYLIGGKQHDTVELSFLQGQETPQSRNWQDELTLSQHYAILQTFGVKAIDHRAMQKHAGS